MLRLNNREREDEIQDEPLPKPSDLLSRDDVFPETRAEVDDQDNDGDGEPYGRRLLAAVPGPVIAAATFVPTFLAIFFGLSYMVSAVIPAGSTASRPAPTTTLLSDGALGTPPISEAVRDPFIAPRVFEPPSTRPADPREVPGPSAAREPLPAPPPAPSLPETPTPAIESTRPTVPPAQARPAIAEPESRVGRAAEAPRQPQAAVLNTTPAPERTPASVAESRKNGREWTPAAAFADREAASRLASSIQQQGYPVEIRQEASSSRPWVVWIGSQPRAERRR